MYHSVLSKTRGGHDVCEIMTTVTRPSYLPVNKLTCAVIKRAKHCENMECSDQLLNTALVICIYESVGI
jgi:hypothetical protein